MSKEPFPPFPPPVKTAKPGGRAPRYASGAMSVVTIRVPKETRARMNYVWKNSDFESVSAVVVAAIEAWLPEQEARIRAAYGKQV